MTKKQIIQKIENIIKKHGDFSIGEIDYIEGQPVAISVGKVLFLGEHFYEKLVMVECILSGESEPFCESQELRYQDIPLDGLEQILTAVELWKQQKNNL